MFKICATTAVRQYSVFYYRYSASLSGYRLDLM